MLTHSSGYPKRRSLPACSLAAAGLSLLLTFSCPVTARADADSLTTNAFGGFYEKDVPAKDSSRDKYVDLSGIQNMPLNSSIWNQTVRILSGAAPQSQSLNRNDSVNNKTVIEEGENLQLNNVNDINNTGYEISENATLEITNGDIQLKGEISGSGDFSIDVKGSEYEITNIYDTNYNYTGMTILKNGILTINNVSLDSSSGLKLYGGTTVNNYTNSHILKDKNIIIDIRNYKLDPAYLGDPTSSYVIYNGLMEATNAKFSFYIDNNYIDSGVHRILSVNGSAYLDNSSFKVFVDGKVDISNGYILPLITIYGSDVSVNNILTENSQIQIGSTIIQGDGINQSLYIDNGETATSIYVQLKQSESGVIDGSKAISEGYLSGLMLTLQGADLVATRGMQAAMAATKEVEDVTFTPWATVSGSSVRYNSGAHADLNSFNMLTGIAMGKGFDAGRLTVGAFFEYGTGSYKTSNSFGSQGSYDGKGDSYYLGWGLLARMDFQDMGPGHFYVEGSGRMGGLYNNYSNEDLRDGRGREAEYDSYAPYYSFHAGLGYIWDVTEQMSLEFYGKYLWTRECGDSMTLSTGEELDFEDIDSSRLRFGTRMDYRVNEYITPYIGVAWEHEFDGESSATTNNLPILEPDLRGDTGIGEIGLTISPSESIPLTVDLGVTGYVGTREGISGSLLVKWTF